MALDRVRGKQGFLKLFTKPVKERRRFIKLKLFVRQSISPKKDFLGQFSEYKDNILFQTGLLNFEFPVSPLVEKNDMTCIAPPLFSSATQRCVLILVSQSNRV